MIPPMEDYNKLLEIHQSFARNVDNLSDFAIKLQDDSYEVGRKRGWIESQAMRDEFLSALVAAFPIVQGEMLKQDASYGKNFVEEKAEKARAAYALVRSAIEKLTEKQA